MVDMDNLAFTSLLWPTDFGKIGLRDYVIFSIAILYRGTEVQGARRDIIKNLFFFNQSFCIQLFKNDF
jgi:hypothetical protein